jgi:hypothetical protein
MWSEKRRIRRDDKKSVFYIDIDYSIANLFCKRSGAIMAGGKTGWIVGAF